MSIGPVSFIHDRHAYDANNNRLWTEDTVAASNSVHQDELNTFDGLNRLTSMERGNLTMGSIASKNFGQDFGLDQLNNWSTFDEDPDGTGMSNLSQSRDHNAANEIEEIDSASTYIAHDAAGNMTTVPKPGVWNASYTLTWDAWNRLIKVEDGMATVAEYQYDGLNRRIVKKLFASGSFDHDEHFYLSEANQVLEVRKDSSAHAHKQFTWGNRYIDDLVLRTRDLNSDGTIDETLYTIQDVNWNVTALADASGTVLERFVYTPYGDSTALEGDFSADADGQSDYDWEYRFTSREYDSETGLTYFRARYCHPSIGIFLSRDHLNYIDGTNLYTAYFAPNTFDPTGHSILGAIGEFFEGIVDWLDDYGKSGPYPTPTYPCDSVERAIASFLTTPEERAAWSQFIGGTGEEMTLTSASLATAFGDSSELSGAISDAQKACEDGKDPQAESVATQAASPHSGSVGGASVKVTFSCSKCCVSWVASIDDTYNFDPKGIPGLTSRTTAGELKTLLVAVADLATPCGWAEFSQRGTWQGNSCGGGTSTPTPIPDPKFTPPRATPASSPPTGQQLPGGRFSPPYYY